jgi:hypothetical protein
MPTWTMDVGDGGRLQLKVVTPTAVRHLEGVVSGPLVGVLVHWDASRTRTTPCAGEGCGPCAAGFQPRWRGYLPIGAGRVCELTADAARDLVRDAHAGQHHIGRRVQITRPTARAAAKVEFLTGTYQPAKLVAVEEVQEMLMRMWGCRQEGVLNAA